MVEEVDGVMGKYDEIREEGEWTYESDFLRAIANELAPKTEMDLIP